MIFHVLTHIVMLKAARQVQLFKQGRYHEDETFEDYFDFDNLESERDTLVSILESLWFRDFMGFVEAKMAGGG